MKYNRPMNVFEKLQSGWYWNRTTNYKTLQLKEIFSILAKTETYIHPSNLIIHDAF